MEKFMKDLDPPGRFSIGCFNIQTIADSIVEQSQDRLSCWVPNLWVLFRASDVVNSSSFEMTFHH